VTHGDLCSFLLEKLSGRSFVSQGRAEDWWREATSKGIATYLLDALADKRRSVAAAAGLLRLDPETYAGTILDIARERDHRLLVVVQDRLDEGDRALLLRVLQADRASALAAARVLYERFGDRRGIEAILETVRAGGEDFLAADVGEIEWLATLRTEASIRAMVALIDGGGVAGRGLAIRHAWRTRSQRVLDVLLDTLRDRVTWVEVDGPGGRACDWAAVSIARMLGMDDLVLDDDTSVRNRQLDQLAVWAEGRRASLDAEPGR
jgi:hypothetical protein